MTRCTSVALSSPKVPQKNAVQHNSVAVVAVVALISRSTCKKGKKREERGTLPKITATSATTATPRSWRAPTRCTSLRKTATEVQHQGVTVCP